ncbi:jun dimerization protein 2 isoform X1 [Agelaius phoeniceus]|uniref:jun dimerization protein 2 isoform X1 n=1 Tax=Agelaius phoeniceus TaxID=39638 RepID=UPI0040550FDD
MQPTPPPATACGRRVPGRRAVAGRGAPAAAGTRHPHRHPAGPGGRGSGGGGGAEPAARARPLRPGPAGTPAARSLCTLDEEEERRKRRREKNKVAAARCRNKKKERTEFLQRESERLELMNAELKAQIEELKQERQQLILMLNRHRPTCIVRTDSIKTPESEANPLLEQLEKK